MHWTKKNAPKVIKSLDQDTRPLALRLANRFYRQGFDEGRAIAMGIAGADKLSKEITKSQS